MMGFKEIIKTCFSIFFVIVSSSYFFSHIFCFSFDWRFWVRVRIFSFCFSNWWCMLSFYTFLLFYIIIFNFHHLLLTLTRTGGNFFVFYLLIVPLERKRIPTHSLVRPFLTYILECFDQNIQVTGEKLHGLLIILLRIINYRQRLNGRKIPLYLGLLLP
jgi:hypothetical protein